MAKSLERRWADPKDTHVEELFEGDWTDPTLGTVWREWFECHKTGEHYFVKCYQGPMGEKGWHAPDLSHQSDDKPLGHSMSSALAAWESDMLTDLRRGNPAKSDEGEDVQEAIKILQRVAESAQGAPRIAEAVEVVVARLKYPEGDDGNCVICSLDGCRHFEGRGL